MELTQQQAFFSALEARLTAAGAEFFPEPGAGAPQLGDGLGFSLPVGEDFHPALVELMVAQLSPQDSLLQFYTTLFTDLEPANQQRLPEALNQINLFCPLGHFGLYQEKGQLYHKYTLFLEEGAPAEALASQAFSLLEWIQRLLDQHYAVLAPLALD